MAHQSRSITLGKNYRHATAKLVPGLAEKNQWRKTQSLLNVNCSKKIALPANRPWTKGLYVIPPKTVKGGFTTTIEQCDLS